MNITRRIPTAVVLIAAVFALAVGARADDGQSAAKENELIEKLRSAPDPEKAIACKELAVHGSAKAVPELAPLLADERLASWSRIALEAIPGPEAGEALRKAMDSLKGRLLVGTINSIGVRRDEAAVDPLIVNLKDADADVASAAAVALGHIGNAAATKSLRASLAAAPPTVRNAVAEGCILCAERLMSEGKNNEAVDIYDEVRKVEVPKQKKIEATRGAILARKTDGIPLLIEQLRSDDRGMFRLGLNVARELPGREVADALADEVGRATPDRAALVLVAFADRSDASVTPALLEVAKSGPRQVRIAAIGVVGRLGDTSNLSSLLESASDADAEVAQAAKAALVALPGDKTSAEFVARLDRVEGKTLAVLIELIGQRRIEATPPLVKAIDHSDAHVRRAALTALGATVGAKDLNVLIEKVISPSNPSDAETAQKALREACVRMPDREACAEDIIGAMSRAPAATKPILLEILGEMGGANALATIGDAVKGSDPLLQDTGSRVLGEWMTLDAAPVLLDLAKTAPSDKYQSRAFRGYLRLARQFAGTDKKRAEMCQDALETTTQPAEQQLVLAVLEKYPSRDGLDVAMKACRLPGLKENGTRVALAIIRVLGNNAGDVPALLAKLDLDPVKIEIIKAEYGAGVSQKDVTKALRKQVGDVPLISLPSPSYSASFGGDPVPGTPKILKVQYRMNGKQGEASFPEDTIVVLPMP